MATPRQLHGDGLANTRRRAGDDCGARFCWCRKEHAVDLTRLADNGNMKRLASTFVEVFTPRTRYGRAKRSSL
jgi:hypothetical protein